MGKWVVLLAAVVSLGSFSPKSAEVRNSVALVTTRTHHCTAFSIAASRWLTEAHCFRGDPDTPQLLGESVRVLKTDLTHDLQLLEGPVVLPLKIAAREPEFGEDVMVIGWPMGWPSVNTPLVFFGRAAALGITSGISEEDDGFKWPAHQMNFFHEGGGPGMSGGPIVNADHQVVGIVEGIGQFPSISLASPTVKSIRQFLELK